MILIKKIEVTGFKGSGSLSWTLDPVVNILGGPNGSGKSTLFRLCHTLLTADEISDNQFKAFSYIAKSVLITLTNGWTVQWIGLGYGQHAKGAKENNLSASNSRDVYDDTNTERPFADLKNILSVFMINSFEQHVDKAATYLKQPNSVSLDDPTMMDLLIEDQIRMRNEDFSSTMELFAEDPVGNENKRNDYFQKYTQIYTVLAHFLVGYDEKFNSKFEFVKQGNKFGYERLSMGEKQILLLLLMVVNAKGLPCVFFMDEPDLSMHIDWKEILVTELHHLNPQMQIILSTHAPSVITGWMDHVKEMSQLLK